MKHGNHIVICIKHSVQQRQPDDNQARNNENETANMHMTDRIVNYGATAQITSHTRQLLDTQRQQTQRCSERLQLCSLLDLCKTKCAMTCRFVHEFVGTSACELHYALGTLTMHVRECLPLMHNSDMAHHGASELQPRCRAARPSAKS